MRGVLLKSDGKIKVVEYEENKIADALGADTIERVRITGDPDLMDKVWMYIDETGLLKSLPLNMIGSYLYGYSRHGGVIAGDVLVVAEELDPMEGYTCVDWPEAEKRAEFWRSASKIVGAGE